MPWMAPERKSTMVSVRLPAALVARADYVARNTDGDVKNRSAVLRVALEDWLPKQEDRLVQLGVLPKKAR
jgi:Arc/MetJ-type ribon-helix-helix transcriptional regulator